MTKPSVPKRIELIFDGLYLISAALLGLWLIFTARESTRLLWGVSALVLAAGDAFHLLPRMAAAYTGELSRFSAVMGIGKLVTSLTMTGFYLLLWHLGLRLFALSLPAQTATVYSLAVVRVALCLLPQNGWQQEQPSRVMGIYRNIPFTLQGIFVLWLYAAHAYEVPAVRFMWLAVLLSFAFYLPVVLWADKKPKLGMLMLPKTCAYIWIICMGFGL